MTILTYLVILIGLVIAGGLIYLAWLPGRFDVRVSRLMQVPPHKVYEKVAELSGWKDWSPWLMHETDTQVHYEGKAGEPNSSFTWDGKHVGAGTLTHTGLEKNKSIQSRIDFTRPFRSSSESGWEFIPKEGGTEVVWYMKGSMPFFFRFMTKMTQKMVALDYEIGLVLLNKKLDPNADRLKLDFIGEKTLEGFSGMFDSIKEAMPKIPQAMHESFSKLMGHTQKEEIKPPRAPCVAYWKVNMRKEIIACDCVVPLSEEQKQKAAPFPIQAYPGGTFFLVRMTGDYKYLKHGWYAANSHVRMKKIKPAKGKPSFEVYENNPFDTKSPNDYVTNLYIPLRS